MLLLAGQNEFLQYRLGPDRTDPCQTYRTCPIFLLPMPSQLPNRFRPRLTQPNPTSMVDLSQLLLQF